MAELSRRLPVSREASLVSNPLSPALFSGLASGEWGTELHEGDTHVTGWEVTVFLGTQGELTADKQLGPCLAPSGTEVGSPCGIPHPDPSAVPKSVASVLGSTVGSRP